MPIIELLKLLYRASGIIAVILALVGCISPLPGDSIGTPTPIPPTATLLSPPSPIPSPVTPTPWTLLVPSSPGHPTVVISTVTAPESLSCETYAAAVELSASPLTLRVGELVTVTVTLHNQGCSQLGLPRYSLASVPTLFDPANPPEVTHSLAILPGGSDGAEFVLRAVEAGLTSFDAYVRRLTAMQIPS